MSDESNKLRVYGSAIVSPRGQIVIPANARKELNIAPGDTLLACGTPHGEGLLLLKVDSVEQMLSSMSERLASFGKIVQDYKAGNIPPEEEAEESD